MNPKLSVLVHIDLDGRHVTLDVAGTLTETNQQALPPLIARARTTFPEARLSVDLQRAQLREPTAIDVLARNLRNGSSGTAPVQITAPAPTIRNHLGHQHQHLLPGRPSQQHVSPGSPPRSPLHPGRQHRSRRQGSGAPMRSSAAGSRIWPSSEMRVRLHASNLVSPHPAHVTPDEGKVACRRSPVEAPMVGRGTSWR